MPPPPPITNCGVSLKSGATHLWFHAMKKIFSSPPDDVRKKAKYELEGTISDMSNLENELKADIRSIAGEVKRSNAVQNKTALNNLLLTSKNKRQRLANLTKQRMTLEQQHEALSSMELNEQVISSFKNTSSALKSLGLDTKINDIEDTMMQLQEGSEDISAINDTLGQSIQSVHSGATLSFDEDDLQAELDILMEEDGDPACIAAQLSKGSTKQKATLQPTTENSMDKPVIMEPSEVDFTTSKMEKEEVVVAA